MKTLAVDFDGVIHNYSEGWKDGTIYDRPIDGAKDTLEALVANGYSITIFTTRLNDEVNEDVEDQRTQMLAWFEENGFKKGVHYHKLTGKKPLAQHYIDDRGIQFTDWNLIFYKFINDSTTAAD